MAYRKSNGKMSRRPAKVEPAVLTLNFNLGSVLSGLDQRYFVDLSQCASIVNRRFYRQGISWAVNSFKLISSPAGATLSGEAAISKLPSTWVLSNAWEKGFRQWQEMNNEALDSAESVRPRFLDFKVFANPDHHAAGIPANMLPYNFAATATAGEWESSKVIIPVSQNTDPTGVAGYEVIATGPNYPGVSPASGKDAVSLIEGYASSRLLPNVLDPNAPADASDAAGVNPENWMTAMHNDGIQQDETVIEDMITENNIAPYPFENDGVNLDTMYPGGANQLSGLEINDSALITGTTVGGTTRFKGGLFPCGLIEVFIRNTADNTLSNSLQIDLVPGHHRGYLCAPMTEM